MTENIFFSLESVLAVFTSLVLTGFYRQWALKKQWLDHPNQRSSHQQATPGGAGIILCAIYSTAAILQFFQQTITSVELIVYLIPPLVGLIGFIDDIRTLSSRARFTAYSLLVTAGCLFFIQCWPNAFISWPAAIIWWVLPLLILSIIWLINLYNFMDGINGIAAFEALFILSASLILVKSEATAGHGIIIATVVGSLIGFLYWNFPVAKVFMGDAGSTFLGALMGILMLVTVADDARLLWVWAILSAVFVVDASYTLLVRLCSGQVWYSAHSSHTYQILARRWQSHSRVVAVLMVINLLWLMPVAWLALRYPEHAVFLLIASWFPLLIIGKLVGAGIAGR